jgi:hypothetical protein
MLFSRLPLYKAASPWACRAASSLILNLTKPSSAPGSASRVSQRRCTGLKGLRIVPQFQRAALGDPGAGLGAESAGAARLPPIKQTGNRQ